MNCQEFTEQLGLYLYGELTASERESAKAHLEGCGICAAALAQEQQFHGLMQRREVLEAPESMLADCRHELMRSVYRRDEALARRSPAGWWNGLQRSMTAWLRPTGLAWQPLAGLALLAVGFWGGRAVKERGIRLAGSDAMQQASFLPLTPTSADIQSIRVDPAQGDIEIVVEEVVRRTIRGGAHDPRIQNLLISTVRNDPNSGMRLETLDVLTGRVENLEVRRALLEAVTEDFNPGVRLKALEALVGLQADPEVRPALVRILRQDQNPGMRVRAIEMLTTNPDRELVGVLQDLVHSEENNYVRLRCAQTLQDLNASVDRF